VAEATKISTAAAIAACNAIVDLLDAGAGPAYIEIRSGTGPPDLSGASTGTLLACCVCSDPAFGDAVDANPGGIATANPVNDDPSAATSGIAGYFRAFDSDANVITQGSAGETDADMILDTVNISGGGIVSVVSWTIRMPEA
jgi:hypothetical protein